MWPRKISMFGKGSGKMNVSFEETRDAFTRAADGMAKGRKLQDKRRFMQEAVLAMLGNIENVPTYGRFPAKLVEYANQLYSEIEEQLGEDA